MVSNWKVLQNILKVYICGVYENTKLLQILWTSSQRQKLSDTFLYWKGNFCICSDQSRWHWDWGCTQQWVCWITPVILPWSLCSMGIPVLSEPSETSKKVNRQITEQSYVSLECYSSSPRRECWACKVSGFRFWKHLFTLWSFFSVCRRRVDNRLRVCVLPDWKTAATTFSEVAILLWMRVRRVQKQLATALQVGEWNTNIQVSCHICSFGISPIHTSWQYIPTECKLYHLIIRHSVFHFLSVFLQSSLHQEIVQKPQTAFWFLWTFSWNELFGLVS